MNHRRTTWYDRIRTGIRTILVERAWRRAGARAVLGTSAINAAILAINLLTGMLTARLLAPAGRGELATITLWPQFLGFALAFGIPTALVYHAQRGIYDRPQLIGTALQIGTLAAIVGGIVGAFLLPEMLHAYSPSVIHTAQACLIFMPFGLMANVLSLALLDGKTVAWYNYIRLSSPIMTLGALATMALTDTLDVERAALAYLVPNIPIALWSLWKVRRVVGIDFRANVSVGKGLLSYGLRSYGAEIAGTISLQLDRLLVVWLLTPAAMGLYVVALSFSRVFQQLPLSIAVVLLPKAAGSSAKRAIDMSLTAGFAAVGLSFAAAIPALFFGDFLLGLFFGPDFAMAGRAFTILTIEAVLGGFVIIIGQAFLATGHPARRSLYEIIGLATIAPMLLWLGPRYGIVGASLSVLGSTVVRVVLMMMSILRMRRSVV